MSNACIATVLRRFLVVLQTILEEVVGFAKYSVTESKDYWVILHVLFIKKHFLLVNVAKSKPYG